MVESLLAFALSSYGVLGNRIVFASLFVVAIVTWALRRGMAESAIWTAASGAGEAESTTAPRGAARGGTACLPTRWPPAVCAGCSAGPTMAAMVFTAIVYLFWNLAAGTFGVFAALHPQDPRDAEPGGERRPLVCGLRAHAVGLRPYLYALQRPQRPQPAARCGASEPY